MDLKTINRVQELLKERGHIRSTLNEHAGGDRHPKAFWPHRNCNVFSLNHDDLKALDALYEESLRRREAKLTTTLHDLGFVEQDDDT